MTNKNLNLNALEQYVSPGIKTLSLQSEGVLCGSYGDEGKAGKPVEVDEYEEF